MNPIITDYELYVALKLHSEPLRRIEDDGNELWVGTWSLSKKRPVFRSGYGYQLHADAHFTKLPFDVEGQRGFGIVFWSQGDPAWYFTGWVEDHREDEADMRGSRSSTTRSRVGIAVNRPAPFRTCAIAARPRMPRMPPSCASYSCRAA